MLNNAEFLKLFLPDLLIEHFEMIKFEEENIIAKATRMPQDFAEFLKKISRY